MENNTQDDDIIEDIFLWDSALSIKDKYKDHSIDIAKLSKDISSDRVAEVVDSSIDIIMAEILNLKRVLKTPQKIREYIRAVLIETEL